MPHAVRLVRHSKEAKKILVVDDYSPTRNLIIEALGQNPQYQTKEAETGEEALRILDSHSFDLIISDIMMPGMSGMELLHAVRQRDPAVAVIMITGNPTTDLTVSAIKKGAVDFLTKPFDIDDLLYKVDIHLRRRQLLKPEACEKILAELKLDDKTETLSKQSYIFDSIEESPMDNEIIFQKIADLALKLVPNLDELQVAPGDIFIASFLASNGGPDTATQTGAQIDIPVGYTLLGHNAGSGTDFIVEEGFWKVNNLTPGQGAQLELQLQVTQERGHTLSGAFHGQQFDPDHNNNLTEATPEVLFSRSDLKLAHTVDPQFALPGHEAIFEVLVENLGPDPASGVDVNYLRPTGYSYANHSASQGSYNSASGLWQVGTLAAGQSATLLVRTQVNGSGGFTSSAQASSHSEDPDPFNNLAFAAVDPFTDLVLDIQADTEAATLNEQVMLTITIDNNGPREADAASVLLEPLAGGLMPVDHFVTHGDYEPVTGVWSIGPLAPGERAEMQFEGQVIVLQDTVMAATVGSDAYELVPGDESGSVTILYGQPGGGAIFADGFEGATE